ncbi:apoptosis-enhancing nuclease-like [Mustelus asterias]
MPSVTCKRVAPPVSEDPPSRRLLQGCSSLTQFLRCTSGVTPSPDGRSAKRKKKLSRRHTRVLQRKVFLERMGILKWGRFRKKERSLNQTCCPSASKLNNTIHSGDAEQPSASDVNVNHSALSGASRPETESSHFNLLPKSTDPNTRARSVQRAAPLTGKDPAGLLPVTAPCLARPAHFCPKPVKYVAIDCEMVGTGPRGCHSELARCSIVNYQGVVVYDKYVKPENPITDYRTRWSGIRAQDMTNATGFDDAQREIMKILKDKIVIGHALSNDFKALKYFHPTCLTRDTSKFPMLKKNAGFPVKVSVSLKNLTKQLLRRKIQVGRDGHCSVEDAHAAMELYQLVEVQWEQNLCEQLPKVEHECVATETHSDVDHYMDDQYWPADLHEDSK